MCEPGYVWATRKTRLPPGMVRDSRSLASRHQRRDLRRDRAQLREESVAHLVAGGARRMGGEIKRGDDLALAIHDRHGDRAQAALELLVDDGKTLRVVVADAVEQGLQI